MDDRKTHMPPTWILWWRQKMIYTETANLVTTVTSQNTAQHRLQGHTDVSYKITYRYKKIQYNWRSTILSSNLKTVGLWSWQKCNSFIKTVIRYIFCGCILPPSLLFLASFYLCHKAAPSNTAKGSEGALKASYGLQFYCVWKQGSNTLVYYTKIIVGYNTFMTGSLSALLASENVHITCIFNYFIVQQFCCTENTSAQTLLQCFKHEVWWRR